MLRALHWLLYFAAAIPLGVHAAGTIKIGLVAEITGQAAEAGMYTINGARLAIEDINKGNGGMNALTAELKKFGIEPVLVRGFTNNTVDFTPIVLSLKRTNPEALGTYIPFSTDQGIFAKQLQQLGVRVRWVGSPTTVSETAMKLAGSALHGSYAVTDFHAGANDEARAYSRAYRERYKIDADNYSAWTYDALHLLALAINYAGSTDPEAVRKAIVGIRGYIGAEGVYNFDESGEGVRGYNVVRNDNGTVVFIKRVDFDR
jgi:branched-chain amino acid transport system substrate-binding protein